MSAENNLKIIKKFINHNLNNKSITKDTTIEELLMYINNIETNYLPLMKEIKKIVKE